MSAKYKSPSFLLPNELNTSANTANDTGINSLYSMSFPGNSGSATLGGLTSTIIQGNLLTISCWYYPTSVGSSDYIIGSGSNSFGPFGVSRNGSNFRIRWRNSAGTLVTLTTTDTPVQTNTWHHLCAIFDTTNSTATDKIQIWINGVRNTTGDTSLTGSGFSSVSASTDTLINKFRTSPETRSVTTNKVDELAFFNKALTSTEIAALYGGTSPNIYPSNLMTTNLNPIAYYPLGEQAQNTGYLDPNNPGSDISGSEWQFPNGVLQDYVMDFDGTSEYIDIPSSSSLVFGSEDFTISFWIKTADSTANILNPISSQGTGFFGLMIYQSKLRWNDQYNVSNLWVINNTQIVENTWINVVIIRNSGTFYVWYNNVPQTLTATSDSQNYNGDNGLRIGSGNLGDLNGQLSNLAIWNSNQTANIAKIYNNGSPQTSYTVTPQNWWKLNADSVYTPSAPNYTTSLNLPQPLSASNYIDFPTGGSGWSFNDGAGNDTPFTVSAWVYNTVGNKFRLLSKNDPTSEWEYDISAGGTGISGIEIYLRDSTGSGNYIGAKAALNKLNEWVHVAFTYDASAAATGLKIYANGEQLTDTDVTVGSYTNMGIKTSKPNIGRTVINVGSAGNVSNLTVFNSELTASQISTLFNFGTPETTPSFSPTLWFKLDNTTTGIQSAGSLTGASYNGTISGSVTATSPAGVAVIPSWKIPSALPITTTPNYTTALDFNVSDKISLGSSVDLGINSSISLWINMPNMPGTYIPLGEDSYIADYLMYISSTYIYIVIGNVLNKTYTHSFNTNEWYNIVIVRQGDSIEVFKNNTSLGTQTGFGTSVTTKIDTIGAKTNGNNPFIGYISNVAAYNSTLTHSQVSTLYNNGTPETAISFSPVSWWKLDTGGSTITDYGSGGNNGTNNGPATQVTSDVLTPQPVNGVSTTLPSTALQQSDLQFDSPYSNYSLSFDGATNYIDCTNYQFSTTKTSISAWFKSSDTRSSEFTEILSKYSDTSAEFQMRLNSNPSGGTTKTLSVFLLQSASTYVTCTTTSTWNDGNWHNVIFTYDSSFASGKLYVDGTLQASDTTTLGVHTPGDANLYIGARQSNSIEKEFLGNIDEVSIWKGTYLSEAQVLEIYNNGKPSNLQNFSGTLPSSWWRLGENAYFDNNAITVPNSISGAPNGVGPGTVVNMLSADAPGTYANGVGTNLDIVDRVGDAPLSTSNSQSYNMIPSDKIPYVPGYVGNQISNTSEMTFNGVDDYFNIGNVSSLNFERTDAFSISAWVKRVGSGSYQSIVYKANNNSPYNGYAFYIDNNNKLGFNITIDYNSTNYFGKVCTSVLNTDWNNVLITYNGNSNVSGLNIYINGSLQTVTTVGTSSDLTGTLSNSIPLNIGARNNTDVFFNGQIDEVAIFDTALNAGQIYNDIYQPTKTGTNQTADIANNPNLPTPVAWYRMGD